MKALQFAVRLETGIRKELEELSFGVLPELKPVLELVCKYQVEFERLLELACDLEGENGKYPDIESSLLLGSDTNWQTAQRLFLEVHDKPITDLTKLWRLYSLVENSRQYYQQASQNSPYPQTRLFFSSLAQSKNMLRRRIDGVLRGMYNEVWSSVGFAPFLLGKD